ncbi:putative nrps-like enzyme protein [Botrytis cinerea BcDW1]|uniref:Putative nrps-like enzyme protein n=1 Tax=Botryotinia fuckeliana (strain BcDW1) TaxID=1290391 RepID=M7U4H3_BOTF1|nr:putative nrps-like enzyme protein [Botrytis cinerea BcDW1]
MTSRNWRDELVPNIIDHIAEVDPEAFYAEYPVSTLTYDHGYRKITFGDFASAVDCVAWWMHETLGPAKDFEVLAYIGPNDLRYSALILSAVKSGYLIFPTSPRNSVAAQTNLLGRLKCRTILSPTPRPPEITETLEANPDLRVVEVPNVEDILKNERRCFTFDKTFFKANQEPFVVVLDMNEDIFAWGMDSLQALTVVRKLRHGLGIASITSSTLYTNPSIARLASTAVKILTDEKSIDSQQITGQLRDSMLKEFRSRIDSLLLPSPTSHRKVDTNHEIVILTGSTGTLGSYILGSLLLTPGVAHIYCLNRSSLGRNLRDSRDQSADIADS